MWWSSAIFILLLSVNSYGVIGVIDENQEECAACIKGSCRNINGIYTRPDLPPGYSLVAQIPRGACRVLVQQLKHTRNVIALRSTNGSYILNGDWKFRPSGVFEGAGTKFTYIKQDLNSLETVSSFGPLQSAVDIMIVNYQTNPGIKYGYTLPVTDPPIVAPPLMKRPNHLPKSIDTQRLEGFGNVTLKDEARPHFSRRRNKFRKFFHWKLTGLTACSKSCGGGIQTYVKTCVKEMNGHEMIVPEKRCSHLDAPEIQPIRCNTQICPPNWEGTWSECSATCGDGVQEFRYQCKQNLLSGGAIILDDRKCPGNKPMLQSRTCRISSCDSLIGNDIVEKNTINRVTEEWITGPWSACSSTCGSSYKTRSVTCPSLQCPLESRPKHVEYCDLPSCQLLTTTPATNFLTQTPQQYVPRPGISYNGSRENAGQNWLVTEWSACSESCGSGIQSRTTLCMEGDNCELKLKPETSRACFSDKHCQGQWFAGPWGPCSDSCNGEAKQKREVLCIVKIRGQLHITNEMTCSAHLKPDTEQWCRGVCPPKWFTTEEWSPCEGSCPNGIQRRDVRCLEVDGRPSSGCLSDEKPVGQRNCICSRKTERESFQPSQDEPSDHFDRSCVDKIRKCKLAVQARLCHYPYYVNHCCESCRRALHDNLQ